jgi:hypothetical protein
MLTQNFRTSAQSALISAIMAVSTFALVVGPDPVRYAAVAALFVLTPTVLLGIRMGSVVAPEFDPQTLKTLEVAPAPKIDEALIATAWLGVAGAFLTGLAAAQRFWPADESLQYAALTAAGLMGLGATPVIAGLLKPWPSVALTTAGLKLSPSRLIRWRDIERVKLASLGVNHLVIVLKPSSRDPGGPSHTLRVRLPAVIEPWVRQAAQAMIERHMTPVAD